MKKKKNIFDKISDGIVKNVKRGDKSMGKVMKRGHKSMTKNMKRGM